jgi:hypothetical protein
VEKIYQARVEMKWIKYKTILKINWMDSSYRAGWLPKEDIEDDIITGQFACDCVSVGFYVGENKRSIIITQNLGDFNISETMQIPKKCITGIRIMK